MMKRNRRVIALALAAALAMPAAAMAQAQPQPTTGAMAGSPQIPQPDQGGVNWSGVGFGAASVGASLLYIPCKLVYALVGGLVGGGAWALTGGNSQVADTIWRSSLGGDYVVTPAMIEGKEPINFSGPTTTSPVTQPPTTAAENPPAAPAAPALATPMAAAPVAAPAPIDAGSASPPAPRGIE